MKEFEKLKYEIDLISKGEHNQEFTGVYQRLTELHQALQLQQTGVIPRSIPDKLYILIQEKKDERYFMFENIEGQANYSHGQCDTIEVIEDWLSKL